MSNLPVAAQSAPKCGYVDASGVPGGSPVLLRNFGVCGAGFAFRAWARIGCAAGRGAQPLLPHGLSNRDNRRPHPARRPARVGAAGWGWRARSSH